MRNYKKTKIMMSRGVFIERESGFLFDKDPPDWGGLYRKNIVWKKNKTNK